METLLTAMRLAELAIEAGIPAVVFNIVTITVLMPCLSVASSTEVWDEKAFDLPMRT